MPQDSDSDMIFFGGVYSAIPNRLIVGPYTHAATFATKPAGFAFAEVPLPAPAERYVVSCLLPASALPPAASSTVPEGSCRPDNGVAGSNRSSPRAEEVGQSATTSPPQSSNGKPDSMASLPSDPKAAVAQLSSKAADFIAQMNARRQQQQQKTTVGSKGATSGMSLAFSRSVEKARHRRSEQQGFVFTKAGAPESVVRQLAQENEDVRRCVDGALGADHFLQCAITQEESLGAVDDVQKAVEFIKMALASSPQAAVYVYSASGRNRASAVAMYYLQREQKLPLSDILPRLPTSTPQISFLKSLIDTDKMMHGDGKSSFDEDHYFHLYFSRRYPNKDQSVIKAAVETRPGDFVGINELLLDEHIFTSSATTAAAATTSTVGNGSFPSKSATTLTGEGKSPMSLSFDPNNSFGAGGSDDNGPVVLTAIDDELIDTICKALQSANVPAGRDDVKESYVRHRRSRNRVLREFLAKDGVRAAGKVDPEWLKTPSVSPQRSAARRESVDNGVNAGGLMSLPTLVNIPHDEAT